MQDVKLLSEKLDNQGNQGVSQALVAEGPFRTQSNQGAIQANQGSDCSHNSGGCSLSEAHFILMQQISQLEEEQLRISKAEKLQPILEEVPSPASVCGHGPQKMSHLIGIDSIGGELASNGPGIRRKSTEDVDAGGLSGGGNHRVGSSEIGQLSNPRFPKIQSEVKLTVQKQDQQIQTVQDETSAADGDKSEPRLQAPIKTFKGVQHSPQVLTKGFKEMIRAERWAQKAHRRRERRRAARQKEVESQPSQFPADSPLGPQQDVNTADIEIKSPEAGTQPPTEDWAPPNNNNNNNIYAGGPRRVPPATSDSTP
jgi:hypothetical protein